MIRETLPDFDKLWNYGKPAETEKKFREILPHAKVSKDTGYLIELLTQIGRTQGLQRKFEDAHKTLDEAEKLLKNNYKRAKVRYLLERGRTYNSSKVFNKARELFLQAYSLGLETTEDNHTIDAAHMMGILEKGDESLRWNNIAIDLAEKTKDNHAKHWLGSLYNNTAWSYHGMGQYEKALELFERYVQWSTEDNSNRDIMISNWCVARTFRSLGRIEEALEKQLNLKKWIEEKNIEEDGYVCEEIGECLVLLGKDEEAKPHFKKAYELLSKDIWLEANEKARLERLKKLGE
ncbi:MAG TPA: tetratricopeptide repeat protein [Ignavibacteria bacterium]|jgi:tetratricopeptide (TPR) repeat protein